MALTAIVGLVMALVTVMRPTLARAAAGTISTIAGSGSGGYSGDGGPATSAKLNTPQDAITDAAGNTYIADLFNHRVRKVDTSGVITTFAGNGTSGFSGDGGPANQAQMDLPIGLLFDSSGNLYIADEGSPNRIRKVDPSGVITTFAGNGSGGPSGDGGPATAAGFNPQYMVITSAGFFFTDCNNSNVRKIDATGTISTFASGISCAVGITADPAGNLYVAALSAKVVDKIDTSGTVTVVAGNGTAGYGGDGGPATAAAINGPYGLAYSGGLFIAEANTGVVRKVDLGGTITTVVGNGTPATAVTAERRQQLSSTTRTDCISTRPTCSSPTPGTRSSAG